MFSTRSSLYPWLARKQLNSASHRHPTASLDLAMWRSRQSIPLVTCTVQVALSRIPPQQQSRSYSSQSSSNSFPVAGVGTGTGAGSSSLNSTKHAQQELTTTTTTTTTSSSADSSVSFMSYEARVVDLSLQEFLLVLGNQEKHDRPTNVTRGTIQNVYWKLCALLSLDPLVIEEQSHCDTVSETGIMTFLLLMVLQHHYGSGLPQEAYGITRMRLWIEDILLRVMSLKDPHRQEHARRQWGRNGALSDANDTSDSEEDRIMYVVYLLDCMRQKLPAFCPCPRKNIFKDKCNGALVQSIYVLLDIVLFKPLKAIPYLDARYYVSELRHCMDSSIRTQLCIMAIDAILEHSGDREGGVDIVGEILIKMSRPDIPYMRLDGPTIDGLIRKTQSLPPSVHWRWILLAYRRHGVHISQEMLEQILESCQIFDDDGTADSILEFVTHNPLLMSHQVASLLHHYMCKRAHGALEMMERLRRGDDLDDL